MEGRVDGHMTDEKMVTSKFIYILLCVFPVQKILKNKPGQASLVQFIVSSKSPEQLKSGLVGGGLVQVRRRVETPLPQVTSHLPHSPQLDQPPCSYR